MSQTPYLALYRKWRPQKFSDIIGQEHITDVLKSEVMHKNVSHAYLFYGSRGTGKTSCAKILAKAVSCENPDMGDPCGICSSCIAATDSFDIIEMDAASNNGVDNIRDLREKVMYMPNELKRKVYIIDEVHMLSTGAFNALLKTLEEPPSHVMFILATTELNKLPATILSRCKRFDFYRIAPEVIAKHLQDISHKEKINLTKRALLLIARLASGSMRDALSMLELFGRERAEIDEEQAAEVLGVVGRGPVLKLLDAIAKNDTQNALYAVSQAYETSKDMGILCSETAEAIRDILIIKHTKEPENFIDDSVSVLETLKEISQHFTHSRLLYCAEILEETQMRLSRSSFSRRTTLETTVIKLCDPHLSYLPEAINDRINQLEAKINNLSLSENNIISSNSNIKSEDLQNKTNSTDDEKKPPAKAHLDKELQKGKIKQNKKDMTENSDTENKSDSIKELSEEKSRLMTSYAEFLEEVKKRDMIIYSMLVDGHAILKGNDVILHVNSAAFYMLSDPACPDLGVIKSSLKTTLGYLPDIEMIRNTEQTPEKELPDID